MATVSPLPHLLHHATVIIFLGTAERMGLYFVPWGAKTVIIQMKNIFFDVFHQSNVCIVRLIIEPK